MASIHGIKNPVPFNIINPTIEPANNGSKVLLVQNAKITTIVTGNKLIIPNVSMF
jgi:hypothetical protein